MRKEYFLLFLTLFITATGLTADVDPLLFVGYNIEDADFAGSSNAALLGAGAEICFSKLIAVKADLMVSLHDNPTNPGKVTFVEVGPFLKYPALCCVVPFFGGGPGLAIDGRGDEGVGGFFFFNAGLEFPLPSSIPESLFIDYRYNSFEAANEHRILMGLKF